MTKKRRNWILIIFGVAVLCVFVGIGAIIAAAAWFNQNLTMQQTTDREAQSEFEAIRQRFPNQSPLLAIRDGRTVYSTNRSPAGPGTSLDRLHVLVWEPDDERLASISIPFWLLRLKSTPIQLSSYASGMNDDDINLRPEDIEKYGPGIILDTSGRSGERILLWAR